MTSLLPRDALTHATPVLADRRDVLQVRTFVRTSQEWLVMSGIRTSDTRALLVATRFLRGTASHEWTEDAPRLLTEAKAKFGTAERGGRPGHLVYDDLMDWAKMYLSPALEWRQASSAWSNLVPSAGRGERITDFMHRLKRVAGQMRSPPTGQEMVRKLEACLAAHYSHILGSLRSRMPAEVLDLADWGWEAVEQVVGLLDLKSRNRQLSEPVPMVGVRGELSELTA